MCGNIVGGAENSIDTLGGNKLACLLGYAVEFARELVETEAEARKGVAAAAQDANGSDKAPKYKKKEKNV